MSVSALEKKAIGDAVSNYVCDDLADHDGIESFSELFEKMTEYVGKSIPLRDLVTVYEPYEYEEGSKLLELISEDADKILREYRHILDVAHRGLIASAIEDTLSLDMHQNDLEMMFEIGSK